ncbi:unnamed protein product [Rotaria sp. Silwood1]|nr:unnamed protein product [Rotaria sp. Silwood1]CAF1055448.1 unnamed protein product [Rotaria sp. Silwood1]CAF3517677.1 unnamed protein product [Rotaria sp. Silwood1]CAF3531764.1 unnamed protein product [Rotaria sp. Silwood1]
MVEYLSSDFPILREVNNSSSSSPQYLRIGVVLTAGFFLFLLYFYGILFSLIVYIYFGITILAIVAAILMFGAAIIYPLLVDICYHIVGFLRATGLFYLFFP